MEHGFTIIDIAGQVLHHSQTDGTDPFFGDVENSVCGCNLPTYFSVWSIGPYCWPSDSKLQNDRHGKRLEQFQAGGILGEYDQWKVPLKYINEVVP